MDLDSGVSSVRRNLVQIVGKMVEGRQKAEQSAPTFALLPQAIADLNRQKALEARDRLNAGDGWHDTGLVFVVSTGGPLMTSNIDTVFRRVRDTANRTACEAAKPAQDPTKVRLIPKLPLYSLRHASASILLNAGVPVAAKMMGHSVDMFTETYAALLEATREAAARAGAFLEAHAPKSAEKAAVVPVVPIERGRRKRRRPRRASACSWS